MIKAGIIGAAGYTGGETIRLLLNHPNVKINFIQSESQAGKKIHNVHPDCFGNSELSFQKEFNSDIDVLFLCKSHGEAKTFLDKTKIHKSVKIIDLSQDFRLNANKLYQQREFIYGLPELNKSKIESSNSVANPGCFATCVQLSLLPLSYSNNLSSDVHICATTGSSGAGQSKSETSHFSWRNNNHSVYKILIHQHLNEISESILQLQSTFNHELNLVPQRGAFTRGIYCVSYLNSDLSLNDVSTIYKDYYKNSPFVHIVDFEVDVKQVVNTNNCFISLQKQSNKLIIVSAIDNLLKGAAGQAVQNMNIMFGLDETEGLKLKPLAY